MTLVTCRVAHRHTPRDTSSILIAPNSHAPAPSPTPSHTRSRHAPDPGLDRASDYAARPRAPDHKEEPVSTSPLIASDKHPRREFNAITQLGLKVLNLASTYKADIAPRVPTGTLEGLSEDLQNLGIVVPGAAQAHLDAQNA